MNILDVGKAIDKYSRLFRKEQDDLHISEGTCGRCKAPSMLVTGIPRRGIERTCKKSETICRNPLCPRNIELLNSIKKQKEKNEKTRNKHSKIKMIVSRTLSRGIHTTITR